MKLKDKIIKNGIFLFATALVLVVVTVAWFFSGSEEANVGPIGADIESSGFGYFLFEAVDTNKNGLLDNGEENNWLPVPGDNVDINNIVPNQYHFYKAVIQTGAKTSMQFKFTGITYSLADPEATEEDFLSRLNVRFRTIDDGSPGAPMTGGEAIDTNMFILMDAEPLLTDVVVYNLDLTGYQNRNFTIFYDVGLYSATTQAEKIQGSSISINKIEFATD
jgi:hypothetical protein